MTGDEIADLLEAEHIKFEVPEPGSANELARLRELVDHIRRLVATRPVINQAKGVLIAHEGCSPDEAFDILRRASQRENRPVREVAEDLVRAQRRQN